MREPNALNRRNVLVLAGVAIVAFVAVGLAVAGGVGPFGAAGDGGRDAGFPTASAPDAGSSSSGGGGDGGGESADGGGSGGEVTATPAPPFDFDIESVEACGRTCRDVTATLVNQQERRATGVTVHTRIHAGRGTDGDVVWEGTYDVGAIGAGASETETQRVELGYFDALKVQNQDGWITIVLAIDTDRRTVTFQERRDVA